MVAFFGYMGKTSLGGKASEQIALAVAQSNGCSYCLSAHTAIGEMHGFDEGTALAPKTCNRSTVAFHSALSGR